MTWVLVVLGAWTGLALPVGVAVGKVLARADAPAPDWDGALAQLVRGDVPPLPAA